MMFRFPIFQYSSLPTLRYSITPMFHSSLVTRHSSLLYRRQQIRDRGYGFRDTRISNLTSPLSRIPISRIPVRLSLKYSRTLGMVFHMKTTLNIDDTVMAQLKREAARQRRTMSELVETALRNLFRSQKKPQELPPLPTFRSGGALVDVADRDALYQAMEGR